MIPVQEEYQQSGAVDRGDVIRSAGLLVCRSVGPEKGAWRTSTINLSPTLATFPLGPRSRFPSFLGSSTLSPGPSRSRRSPPSCPTHGLLCEKGGTRGLESARSRGRERERKKGQRKIREKRYDSEQVRARKGKGERGGIETTMTSAT